MKKKYKYICIYIYIYCTYIHTHTHIWDRGRSKIFKLREKSSVGLRARDRGRQCDDLPSGLWTTWLLPTSGPCYMHCAFLCIKREPSVPTCQSYILLLDSEWVFVNRRWLHWKTISVTSSRFPPTAPNQRWRRRWRRRQQHRSHISILFSVHLLIICFPLTNKSSVAGQWKKKKKHKIICRYSAPAL